MIHVKGTAIFPYFTKPDTKFDADGVYKSDVRLSYEEAAPLLEQLETMQSEKIAQEKKKAPGKRYKEADLPLFPELDDAGEETGNWIARVKSKASGVSRKTGQRYTRVLPLFDSKGQPFDASQGDVRGGASIVAAVSPHAWCNPKGEVGVTMRLEAVQVITLGGSSGSTRSFGFSAVDGGFVAADAPAKDEVVEEADTAEDYDFS